MADTRRHNPRYRKRNYLLRKRQRRGLFQRNESILGSDHVGLAIVFAVVSIILAQFSANGAAGKILSAITDILRIAAAVLLIASLMGFVSTRVEGLGYIFGSDENVLDEIQTEENMRSAYTAIAGFAFYAVTWLVALVACFCGMTKAAKKTNA